MALLVNAAWVAGSAAVIAVGRLTVIGISPWRQSLLPCSWSLCSRSSGCAACRRRDWRARIVPAVPV
jgi:hypothetical protein